MLQCKNQTKLYNSFLKYGPENHKFEILYESNCQVEKNKMEEYYVQLFNCTHPKYGLNCHNGGKHSPQTEETKEKIRQKALGRKRTTPHPPMSEETKKKIGDANRGRRWKRQTPVTEETRKKISDALKNKAKNGWVSPHKGKKVPREFVEKALAGRIKRYNSPEQVKLRELRLLGLAPKVKRPNITNNHKKYIILNMETGIFYNGIQEAAKSVPQWKASRLTSWLGNRSPNRSQLKRV